MLFVGLGNPGLKYQNTRHNVGFMVIDNLVKSTQAIKLSSSSFNGELYKSKENFFLKPLTFMNLSGESVVKVANFYKIDTQNIVVIHDDLDLPFGTIKIKRGGGHGGHNGLKSIDQHVGKEYIRIRIGIGKPAHKGEVVSYVLHDFTASQQEELPSLIEHATKTSLALLENPLEIVTSQYTLKKK
jgi:PTH1 family peptidyl-tRNA hydrolase